jgi:hypothetical protein
VEVSGEQQIVRRPAFRRVSHPGHDKTGYRPLASGLGSKHFAFKSGSHQRHDFNVGDSDVFESYPAAPSPKAIRGIA